MKILGIDFTSAPSGSKPITVAVGDLAGGVLHIGLLDALEDFKQFEDLLKRPGPWVAGIDLLFGQPKRLIEELQRRTEIVCALRGEGCQESYGHLVKFGLAQADIEYLIKEPDADRLDAVLCAVQAAWAYSQPNRGIPAKSVPDEGWIVDPSQMPAETSSEHLH